MKGMQGYARGGGHAMACKGGTQHEGGARKFVTCCKPTYPPWQALRIYSRHCSSAATQRASATHEASLQALDIATTSLVWIGPKNVLRTSEALGAAVHEAPPPRHIGDSTALPPYLSHPIAPSLPFHVLHTCKTRPLTRSHAS